MSKKQRDDVSIRNRRNAAVANDKVDHLQDLTTNKMKNDNYDQIGKTNLSHSKSISLQTWIVLVGVYNGIIFLCIRLSFDYLPAPKSIKYSKSEDFVEENARFHLNEIVGFGHRPSGSIANDVDTVNYILSSVKSFEKLASPAMKFEVDVQHPSGSFTINFLSGFASYYSNVSNTIIKISPVDGKTKPALLLNCHTDSVVGVPGASDDAVACAVLLEVMRALVVEHNHPLLCPVIFLFNGAEENILQASHGFITQHPWAKEIGAFINLEAAGAGGKEVVFQTGPNNPWLANAWSAHAPHPFGTIVAQELYQMGVIPAETDFRIFRDFGHIPGIDLAYVRNGYVYHTIYDNIQMIHPGSIQRAGDNILAVLRHLVMSKKSLLPNPSIYKHGATTFLDLLGLYMLTIPFRLVVTLNWICSAGGFLFIIRRIVFAKGPGFAVYGKQLMKAVGTVILSWIFCFLTILLICGVLTILGKAMSFYSHPSLVVLLYALPGFLSMLMVNWIVNIKMFPNVDPWRLESIFFDAYLLIWSALLFQLNNLQIHSSLILLLCMGPILLIRCLLYKNIFMHETDTIPKKKLLVYFMATLPHSVVIMYHATLVMEFFIPLLNRLGSTAPPDLVIGILTAMFVCVMAHFNLSTIHTVKSFQKCFLPLFLLFTLGFLLACSGFGFPYSYTPTNPITKRLYIQHTSREFYNLSGKLVGSDAGLWINTMDYPGFSTDMGSKTLQAASATPCSGLFCHFPWLIPIQHIIRGGRYLPAARPSNLSAVKNPLDVKVTRDESILLTENATTIVYKKKISFLITGPSHMSIQIGTLKSHNFFSQLNSWSLNGAVEDVVSFPDADFPGEDYKYNEWHFVYYGAGLEPLPWQPWFEFLVFRNRSLEKSLETSHPSVEFGFSAQHYPTDRNIPIRGQTIDIRSLVSELYDWVMPISWISTYKNYLF